MRNPNGYGSVVKLSGNRRRPFHVRKTVGWNEKGHPVYQTLDYVATREEGMILLAQFNKNPWDVDKVNMTLAALFELWLERKAVKLGRSNLANMKASYQHCKALWGRKYSEIKAYHMQDSIDHCGCGYSTQGAIKALWNHLDKFALELDVTTRNYASLLQSAPIPETSKSPFSEGEVKTMWAMQHQPWVDSILFLLYTGFRISEMLDLRKSSVDLVAGTRRNKNKIRQRPRCAHSLENSAYY